MKIPTYNPVKKKKRVAIEYHDFIDLLEKVKGYNTRDFAGRFSTEWQNEVFKEISKEFGLDPKDAKWLNDISIRTENHWNAWWAYSKMSDKRPYLDFWHWLLEHQWYNLSNGCYQTISIEAANTENFDDLEKDAWVIQILTDIIELCKDHPACDGEDINFWIEW